MPCQPKEHPRLNLVDVLELIWMKSDFVSGTPGVGYNVIKIRTQNMNSEDIGTEQC